MLAFAPPVEMTDGRRVRSMRFEERSTLAVSAACVVANSMRDALTSAFAVPVELRLFEALIPSHQGWQAIMRDAMVYTAPGIAMIVRPKDAQAFARAAFGEFGGPERTLSAMESAVLDRIVATLGPACSGVATGSPQFHRTHANRQYVTYFEMQIETPARFRIGVALEAEPTIQTRATLGVEALLDVQLELCVQSAPTTMLAAQVAALEPGAVVPMTDTKRSAFTLVLAGRPLASGECGVQGDRFAMRVL